ncbi:hypothetical protein T4E_6757 [Trichinella pseudospiralis]|uniref:Uncharacterized protein n=1 Tax=Trichinella pseudospiralis TaxID=6337 RepID=A0A0V0Y3X8_TRIPS|nr:hypothetical protein T4E_6757 [Trichinella pseudospiralis]
MNCLVYGKSFQNVVNLREITKYKKPKNFEVTALLIVLQCKNTFKCHDQRCTTDEHIADSVECRMYCNHYAIAFEDGVV